MTFPTTPESLVRPLIVTILLGAVGLGVAYLLTRSWAWGALISSGVLLFSLREPVIGGALLGFGLWWQVVGFIRRRAGRPPASNKLAAQVARASGIFSVAYLLVMAGSAVVAATTSPVAETAPVDADGAGGPNIYMIMLDGYPQPATLRSTFSIDNSAFLDELESLGFDVSASARTNYNKTWLTLASLLNGAYVDDLLAQQSLPTDEATQIRWLQHLIDRASLLDVVRDRGYVVKSAPPPFDSAEITSADQEIGPALITEFEARLISLSPWALLFEDPISNVLADNQRRHVVGALEAVAGASRDSTTPTFVFAHVHSPHPPFVLPAGGNGPACFPESCTYWHPTIEGLHISFEEYNDGLREQIEALDRLVLGTVREVISDDPEAVVILFSDHGSRYSLADPDEHFRSLLAARTPGVERLYPDDAHAVNLLRTLFEAYFETDTPALPYAAWYGEWAEYMRLQPFRPQ